MSSPATKLIIIIDDDEEDCYFVQLSIQKHFPDYELLVINDSLQVVEQLEKLQRVPALILLDLYMPMDGVDVLTQIKELPQYTSVPVAVFSGLPSPDHLTNMERIGVSWVAEKPSDLTTIDVLLTKLLTQ